MYDCYDNSRIFFHGHNKIIEHVLKTQILQFLHKSLVLNDTFLNTFFNISCKEITPLNNCVYKNANYAFRIN